jgi:ubiquinol-cytochrome c reductase cytochrome b subunit
LFFLPWLDRSPVKSIRYRGIIFKLAVAIFVVAFIGLGWLGAQSGSATQTLMAQILTVVYFAFFLLMPVYTKLDTTKPVPERVTGE